MRRIVMLAVAVSVSVGSVTGADEPVKADPKATAVALEGDWVLLPHKTTLDGAGEMVSWVDAAGFGHFKPLGVSKLGDLSYLRVKSGKLKLLGQWEKEATTAVAIDATTAGEKDKGFCRFTATVEGGEKVVGSCRVVGNKLEVRIPEACVCPKSGDIAVFQRVSK